MANAVFDRRGRMVAQAVTGTPGHINSLAIGAANMLEEFPPETLEPGDVLVTNDPYLTAGQLLDVTVLVPVWRVPAAGGDPVPIAYFGSTIHHTDVGGYGIGAGARDCFEEGLWIPICKLMRGGRRNEDVWRFILANVRQPDHMAGDLHAQMASGEVGAQRLAALATLTTWTTSRRCPTRSSTVPRRPPGPASPSWLRGSTGPMPCWIWPTAAASTSCAR